MSAAAIDVTLIDAQTGGVYGDLERVGPGTTRRLRVDVGSGSYAFQCDTASSGQQTGPTVVVPGHVTGGTAVPPPEVQATIAAVASDKTYVLSRTCQPRSKPDKASGGPRGGKPLRRTC